MPIAKFLYSSLGSHKRMCDVVFAGSHDAGITQGGGATRAQRDPIEMQAVNGARFFDVRIGAFQGRDGVKFKTFHAADVLQRNKRSDITIKMGTQSFKEKLKIMSLPIGGRSGEHLTSVLEGAKSFVDTNKSEFVVLNFSKSTNMDLVMSEIDSVLGDFQYGAPGPLNTRTLAELQGRVICVFAEESDTHLQIPSYKGHAFGAAAAASRFFMKNLFKAGGGYNKHGNGIQYYGKGGMTDALSGEKNKIDGNAGLQQGKILAGAGVKGCQELLGMVYITATGGIGSIKNRDKKLWKDKRINPLLNIWESDQLAETVMDRLPRNIIPSRPDAVPVIKKFFPNIVMIDFVDERRCSIIYDINRESTGPMGDKTPRDLVRSSRKAV